MLKFCSGNILKSRTCTRDTRLVCWRNGSFITCGNLVNSAMGTLSSRVCWGVTTPVHLLSLFPPLSAKKIPPKTPHGSVWTLVLEVHPGSYSSQQLSSLGLRAGVWKAVLLSLQTAHPRGLYVANAFTLHPSSATLTSPESHTAYFLWPWVVSSTLIKVSLGGAFVLWFSKKHLAKS